MSGAPKVKADKIPEITPDMIKAGSAELRDFVMMDVGPARRDELAEAVYVAMEAVKSRR